RDEGVRKLERGELLMLVNCSLFDEGFDLPAIEVCIMGTATNSLSRYIQWFGRALRLMLNDDEKRGYDALDSAGRRARIAASVKSVALIIDHGGNVPRHDGPPDIPRLWTIERYSKKSVAGETVPYRVCANPGLVLANPDGPTWADFREAGWKNEQMLAQGLLTETDQACAQPYERIYRQCPYCDFLPEPVTRSDPEHVEGDLQLLDEETLAKLYGTYDEARQSPQKYAEYVHSTRLTGFRADALVNRHKERLAELTHLDHAMAYWGGHWSAQGDSDSMCQRRFFHTFGIDVLSVRSLKRADAELLRERIEKRAALDSIVIPEYS